MSWQDNYRDILTKKVIDCAQRIINGNVEVLLGCRELVPLIHELQDKEYSKHTDLFNFFIAVESESDDLPLGEERKYWNFDALKEKDKIRDRYSNQIGNDVVLKCKELIVLMSEINGKIQSNS